MLLTDELRSFELFKACSTDFLTSLSKISKRKTVPAGSLILTEGQFNDRLLILSKGRVEVKVNGERVAYLFSPGDLIGEISVLAGRPATATISSTEEVSYLEIDAPSLNAAIKEKSEFGYELYRLFGAELSDKIIETNEKARQFEIANRALVDINRTLDQKVQERAEATFRSLSEVHSSLNSVVDELSALGTQPTAIAHLKYSIDLLKPMRDAMTTERTIRSRRILVVEPDRKHQTIARMALGGTGAKLDVASTREEVIATLQSAETAGTSPDIIFISSAMSSVVPDIKRFAPQAKVVLIAGNELVKEVDNLKQLSTDLSNIISRHDEDRGFTVKNMMTTVTKLVSKDFFGFEKYMMWGVDAQSRPVESSTQRAALIAEMEDHLKSIGVRGRVTERAAAVAEELLMNAIYDAPVANGVHHYAHLPRTTAVDLKKNEVGEFRFGCDGMMAAISVSDPFGKFRMKILLDYLEKNTNSRGENIQVEGKGGAGRGLHQIINASDLVVFNVRDGAKTEVIAFFSLDPNAKDEAPRQFHYFLEA